MRVFRGRSCRNQTNVIIPIRVDHHKHTSRKIHSHYHETLFAHSVVLFAPKTPHYNCPPSTSLLFIHRPVDHAQARHAPEFAPVVADQSHIQTQGVGGDQRIQRADGCSLSL